MYDTLYTLNENNNNRIIITNSIPYSCRAMLVNNYISYLYRFVINIDKILYLVRKKKYAEIY